jgi:membrane protein DedA with SNARE-associated domain
VKLNDVPRTTFLWLAALRVGIGILALPLAPFLYREHFIVLVLMRPTKEVLLAAGFLIRQGKVGLGPVLLAAVPLMLLGVWQFFYLGRVYSTEIRAGEVPGIGGRVIKPDKVKKLQKGLDKKGPRLVFLGRLAVFSSAMVATAAGAGKMSSREFLVPDGLGALASVAITLGAGYFLGAAYEKASPLLTVVGVVALIGAAFVLGRFLRRD